MIRSEHHRYHSKEYNLGYAHFVYHLENGGETLECPFPDNSKEQKRYQKGWDDANCDSDFPD